MSPFSPFIDIIVGIAVLLFMLFVFFRLKKEEGHSNEENQIKEDYKEMNVNYRGVPEDMKDKLRSSRERLVHLRMSSKNFHKEVRASKVREKITTGS